MGYRYIGTKSRVLNELLAEIARITPAGSTIADVMCGTASVCAALRNAGYNVVANDVMTYSYHHARVKLCITSPPDFHSASTFIEGFADGNARELIPPATRYERILIALNNVRLKKGYFFKEFSPNGKPTCGDVPRQYFTPENAMKIDGIRNAIAELAQRKLINDLEHSLLLHDLIMATNDIANIAGTYGHYLSKFVDRAKCPLQLYPTQFALPQNDGNHVVYQGYAEDVAAQIECDLCYMDPPYIKRQYAANYHILETLARGDSPESIGLSGLRPWRDQYSNFCTKTKIRSAFRKIITSMQCSNFLISYSEDGLLSIPQLIELLSEFGETSTKKFANRRFKSNVGSSKATINEYLIHLRR